MSDEAKINNNNCYHSHFGHIVLNPTCPQLSGAEKVAAFIFHVIFFPIGVFRLCVIIHAKFFKKIDSSTSSNLIRGRAVASVANNRSNNRSMSSTSTSVQSDSTPLRNRAVNDMRLQDPYAKAINTEPLITASASTSTSAGPITSSRFKPTAPHGYQWKTGVPRKEQVLEAEFNQLNDSTQQVFAKKGITPTKTAGTTHLGSNFYTNILPYDHSRFVIPEDGTFYYNASLIGEGGVDGIACQAPRDDAQSYSFLKMCMHAKKKTVVMLTKLEEATNQGAVKKSHQYWPERGQSKIFKGKNPSEEIEVTIERESMILSRQGSRDYLMKIRHLKLVDCATNETYIQKHIHYFGWPDFDTPDGNDFEQLLELVKEDSVIAHCSGGVGRTGVFFACRKGCREIFNSPNPKLISPTLVKDTVAELRQYRDGLVQTPEQYGFIYERFNWYYQQVQVVKGL